VTEEPRRVREGSSGTGALALGILRAAARARALMAPMRPSPLLLGLLAASCVPAAVAPPPPAASPRPPPRVAVDPLCPDDVCRPLHASIAASDRGACAVRADGRVFCWGYGVDAEPRVAPTALSGASDAVQVSVGDPWMDGTTSCLLRRTGEVRCWDDRRDAALAPAPPGTTRAVPTPIAGLPPVVEVQAGRGVACAVAEDGGLWCWSRKERLPVVMPGAGAVAHLSGDASCVVRRDGTVACADDSPRALGGAAWKPVPGVAGAVSVIDLHGVRCAFLASADPACWDSRSAALLPPMPGLRGAVGFAGGAHEDQSPTPRTTLIGHALRRDGTVAWTSDALHAASVEVVDGLAGGAGLVGGEGFACVLRAHDEVWCRGERWTLGVTSHGTTDRAEPAEVPGLDGVVEIQSGGGHTCAVTGTGRVACWGNDLPTAADAQVFPGATVLDDVGEVVTMATSPRYGCAARRDGSVLCWGRTPTRDPGERAWGDRARWARGVQPGVRDVVQLSVDDEACGVRRGGRVVCWSKPGARTVVRPLSGVSDARQVVVKNTRVCVVRESGRVACQGSAEAPLRDVPGLAGTVRLTPEGLALRKDGAVASVSFPYGDAPPVVTLIPGIEDARALASSQEHGCAVRADGHVACWGENRAGQLGDGTYESGESPVTVRGLDDAVEVVASSGHTCALRRSGRVACWGSALRGELGAGRLLTDRELEPARVPLP